ncbi:acyltransferase [Mucilaginibacter mali]|uniref:Acyltransferase n=1 Tax=Mucilaginibacter mali TaxID=2740462 RepID=A0A7D4Q752_9SPHI|nr:acyltransferase [Mucilaginibacter mali]QKJ29791.1 acyltransferase [Mucilaginibacter mali]
MPINIHQLFKTPVNHVPAILDEKYFPVLDGLRGVAILFVLAGHLFFDTQKAGNIGLTGVEIFFVLSGFLITTLLLKEKVIKGSVSLRYFYIRRILRIVPVAYLYLAVLVALNIVFKLHVPLISFLSSLLYIHNITFYKGDTSWSSAHFWTLGVEEQFYLMFPFILVKSIRKYIITAAALLLAVPVLQFLVYHNIGVFYANNWVHKISVAVVVILGNGTLAILIGSLTALLVFKQVLKPGGKTRAYYLSTLILITAIIFRIFCPVLVPSTYTNQIVFAIFISGVIYLCLSRHDFLGRLLSNKIIVKVGVLSYSIYVWQQLFTHQQPWQHIFRYGGAWWFNMPLLLLVAYTSYQFFERKFLNIKDRFKAA